MTNPSTPTDLVGMPADNYPSGGPHPTNAVLWTDDGTVPKPLPKRYITLTNNTDHTVYPFLIAPNSNVQPGSNPPTPQYDPKDPLNQDYRGYIGYSLNGTNYLGLPSKQSATIPVPLVFWDSCRLHIANNSENLIPDAIDGQPNPPINPYQYYVQSGGQDVYLWCQEIDGEMLQPSGNQVVVMWYHATIARAPLDDAPSQFVEFTIRDPWLKEQLNPKIDAGDVGPLINYDVSYVDILYLPVAMQALDVPIPNINKVAPYGWIGAIQTDDQFQTAFQNFTNSDPTKSNLGQYFNGKGYTQYYTPDDIKAITGIKLPSGEQAIQDGPFSASPSSYDNYMNMLESIDSDQLYDYKVSVNISMTQGETYPSQTVTITLNGDSDTPSRQEQLNTLQDTVNKTPVWLKCSDDICQSIFGEGTQLQDFTVNQDNNQLLTATLSQAVTFPSGHTSCSVDLVPQISDYVVSQMVNLWYSWAQYYVNAKKQVPSQTYSGSITVPTTDPKLGRVLTFDTPIPIPNNQPPLVPGMLVQGPGLPTYSPSEGAFCTIAEIVKTTDEQTIKAVKLSEFVAADTSGPYQFDPPQTIRWSDATVDNQRVVQPIQLQLTSNDNQDLALAFAQTVYQAMSAMSTATPDATKQNPFPMQLLVNIIGCNVGFLPNIGIAEKVGEIASEITINIKSALRGVPDFTDTTNYPESKWYPEPSQQQMVKYQFNAYNLNPYVWFVHKQLGLSAYGFSVDDDTADVGANAATHLQISIGGPGGIQTKSQWSTGAPYGLVSGSGQLKIDTINGETVYKIANLPHTYDPSKPDDLPVYYMLTSPDTSAGQQGANVNGKYIQPGTWVKAVDASDYSVILNQSFASDAPLEEPFTYTFFGAVVGVGQAQSGNVIVNLDPIVIEQLTAIVTQTGNPISVIGPGMPPKAMVQSVDPTNNSVTVSPGVEAQSPGVYKFG